MTQTEFKTGDKVSWNSTQGKVTGTVKKKADSANGNQDPSRGGLARQPATVGTERQHWQEGSAQAGCIEADQDSRIQMTAQTLHDAFADFKQVVNMSASALAAWLKTDESKAVGFKTSESGESVGHRSGKKIIVLLGKTQAEFTSGDIAHARKVVGYVHRHLAQRPAGDVSQTHWRYSLMNWGHDPP